ncbi:MAG: hypothetical protein H7A43_02195 [Verrucomicrobia bacterium]|nr:hypothetical protein [Kiritimatiellia bacterium]MCP5487433.1 hypothetical protein [Verrucomicrobiota bacterium]
MSIITPKVLAIVGILGVCIAVVILLSSYSQRVYADPARIPEIVPGMTRSNVIQILGVMYDNTAPGIYTDADAVIALMTNKEAVAELYTWGLRHTKDMFHVAFDASNSVLEVRWEKR